MFRDALLSQAWPWHPSMAPFHFDPNRHENQHRLIRQYPLQVHVQSSIVFSSVK